MVGGALCVAQAVCESLLQITIGQHIQPGKYDVIKRRGEPRDVIDKSESVEGEGGCDEGV